MSLRTLVFSLYFFLTSFSYTSASEKEDSTPLLRIFPAYRKEECDWAIRMFICYKCVQKGEQYAQKIYFYKDGPYRVHGCYSEKKGFYVVKD